MCCVTCKGLWRRTMRELELVDQVGGSILWNYSIDRIRMRWLTNSSAETETAAHNRSMAWPSKLSSHHLIIPRHQSSMINHQLSIINYQSYHHIITQPSIINHQSSIINYQLSKLSSHQHPAINYQLSIISHHFIINLSFRVFSVALLPPKIWEYQYKGKL